jgi:hypothetical protein
MPLPPGSLQFSDESASCGESVPVQVKPIDGYAQPPVTLSSWLQVLVDGRAMMQQYPLLPSELVVGSLQMNVGSSVAIAVPAGQL